MSTFRRAQGRAHPNKTNTLFVGIIGVLILIVTLQIWLLTAVLNTALGGDRTIVWPAFYGSLGLFLGGAGLLQFLPQPIRRVLVVGKPEPFMRAALAWRTLAISAMALALSFGVWFMWSAISVKLSSAGFAITPQQRFWITAAPVVLGSLLRIPYGLIVSRFGSRNAYTVVTLVMLVPCVGTAIALRDPTTSFSTLIFWSALTGVAGANFATSMATVTLWFPKQLQGSALGINGLGNLGVTLAQFAIPAVIGVAAFGSLSGAALAIQTPAGTQPVWLGNAALMWVPLILLCAAAIWFGTENYPQAPKSFASQMSVARRRHTWILSALYFLTFGAFVAMGASLPLIINEVFAHAPGGAPNPLFFAPFAVLVATLTRPLGGWLADKWTAGGVTATSIAIMGVCGFSLSQFLEPDAFTGFFWTIMILCGAAGLGNGSIFKIIPTVMGAEAGPVIGFVSCIGALGGFFPPLLLGWCMNRFGSPAWAYTGMAVFALGCFVLNWVFYWRRTSSTHC